MPGEAEVFLVSGFLLFLGIASCLSCCFCCCAPAICALFSFKTVSNTSHDYSVIPQANAYSSTNESNNIPVVEAYIVPPLAAVNPKPSSTASSMLDETIAHPVSTGGFQDLWAAILFLIQLFIMLSFSIQALFDMPKVDEEFGKASQDAPSITIVISFVLVVTSFVLLITTSILYFIVQHAEAVISIMLLFNVFILAGSAVLSLLAVQLFGCILFTALAAVNYCYYLAVQDRLPFASAVLSTACAGLKTKLKGLYFVSISIVGLQVVWTCLWGYAAYALAQNYQIASEYTKDDDEVNTQVDVQYVFYGVLYLLSYYWTNEVLRVILSLTTSGTVACWYFQPLHPAPIKSSLFRAITYSLGSACFGALIVAILEVLRILIRICRQKAVQRDRDRRSGRNSRSDSESDLAVCLYLCFLTVLETIVGMLENTLRYINK
jgi:hypothetical protein